MRCCLPSRYGLTHLQPLRRGITSDSVDVSNEVLLYTNNKTKPGYFKLIAVISGLQMIFWAYLSYFAFTELREEDNKRVNAAEPEVTSWGTGHEASVPKRETRFSWLSSLKWRLALSLLSLSAGVFFAVTACMYPLRIVNRLYFIKPTNAARIHTYTPLGSVRTVEIPLIDITCTGERLSEHSQVALKARGYSLYFLMDKQGSFTAPRMFDTLIASRKRVF